jgi:hypothetical protein
MAERYRIVELANPDDHVPVEVNADPDVVLAAMSALGSGNPAGIVPLARAVARDPGYGLQAGINALRGSVLSGIATDPHDYGPRMAEAARLLASDAVDGADLALQVPDVHPDPRLLLDVIEGAAASPPRE